MLLFEHISQKWYFIGIAYLSAFLPWTSIAAYDFINQEWKSVRTTLLLGLYHLLCVIIPMPYILLYITSHWKVMDFSESFAATIALSASFIHLLRTLWGLWQIFIFRSWVIKSILRLQLMGIEYKSKKSVKWDYLRTDKRSMRRRAKNEANSILINNTVIDNQIFHGETQCFLRYKQFCYTLATKYHLKDETIAYVRRARFDYLTRINRNLYHLIIALLLSIVMLLAELFWNFIIRITLLFKIFSFPLLMFLDLVRFVLSFGCVKMHYLQQTPYKPVDVWIRWATVFAAQGLQQWIKDFRNAQDPDKDNMEWNHDKEKLFQLRRDYFAGELLAGMCHVLIDKSEIGEGENFMLWEEWEENSGICGGTIKRDELLHWACKTGKGLPFGVPHIVDPETLELGKGELRFISSGKMIRKFVREGLSSSDFVGYRFYNDQMERYKGSLPVSLGKAIQKFKIEHLEWLAVLLFLGFLKHKHMRKIEEVHEAKTEKSFMKHNGVHQLAKEEDIKIRPVGMKSRDLQDDMTRRESLSVSPNSSSTDVPALGEGSDIKKTAQSNIESAPDNSSIDHEPQHKPCMLYNNLLQQLGFNPSFQAGSHSDEQLAWSATTLQHANRFQEICSFPLTAAFISTQCLRESRYNRQVCKVGELIDIWIALEAGRHYEFLQKHDSSFDHDQFNKRKPSSVVMPCNALNLLQYLSSVYCNQEDKSGFVTSNCGKDHMHRASRDQSVRIKQHDAENARLLYQYGDQNQSNWHLEQSLTFMGYSMEYVRTQLAHWVHSHQNIHKSTNDSSGDPWKPSIQNMKENEEENDVRYIEGDMSEMMWKKMKTIRDTEWLKKRTVQVQLLWEAQLILQGKLSGSINTGDGDNIVADTNSINDIDSGEGGNSVDNGPGSIILIILCILSFPALTLEVMNEPETVNENNTDENWCKTKCGGTCLCLPNGKHKYESGGKREFERWKILVRASCGPQDIYVIIRFEERNNEGMKMKMCLGNGGKSKEKFEWEWWRDSFLCRLERLRSWQEDHGMQSVPFIDTLVNIEENIVSHEIEPTKTGRKFNTWKGWRPFRPKFCRFELESNGFILEYKKSYPVKFRTSHVRFNRIVIKELSLLRRHRQVVKYKNASLRMLHNNCLEIFDIFKTISDEKVENNNEPIPEETNHLMQADDTDASKQAREMMGQEKDSIERAVILLETIAMEKYSLKCLQECVNLLKGKEKMSKNIPRAMRLLQLYVSKVLSDHNEQRLIDTIKRVAEAVNIACDLGEEFPLEFEQLLELCRIIVAATGIVTREQVRRVRQMLWKAFLLHRDLNILSVLGGLLYFYPDLIDFSMVNIVSELEADEKDLSKSMDTYMLSQKVEPVHGVLGQAESMNEHSQSSTLTIEEVVHKSISLIRQRVGTKGPRAGNWRLRSDTEIFQENFESSEFKSP